MKKELDNRQILLALGVVALVLVVIGLAVFKPSFGPGPLVKPRPFQPPANATRGKSPFGPPGVPASKLPAAGANSQTSGSASIQPGQGG